MFNKNMQPKLWKAGQIVLALTVVICALTALSTAPRTAYASHCSSPCGCSTGESNNTITHIRNEHGATRVFITEEFMYHQNWLFGANGVTDSFFHSHFLRALMMMTEQLTSNAMMQMLQLGTFFDAQIQIETQRIYQRKAAEAHKDYQPNTQMCVIGGNTRSLASSQRRGEFTRFVMSQRSLERNLHLHGQGSAYDSSTDKLARYEQFARRYCDSRDNGGATANLCPYPQQRFTLNKDIDYARTIDSVTTLDVTFDTAALGDTPDDSTDVIAMSNNLYNSDVLDLFNDTESLTEADKMIYMDVRAIAAKRNVIENSFNAIVGMKALGSEDSINTMNFSRRVLEQLGISDINDQLSMLGGNEVSYSGAGTTMAPTSRPSYYSQMQLLSQRVYQNPEFLIDLYDKPANVARKDVAMQAIGLMLDRDMFDSELRSEMNMAIMLELEIMKYQTDLQNRLNALKDE
ncbi:MAG TPA: hypothetical protein EYG18_02380 [Micavibrio sp.]|nr:hypothetical protein [Micavibrio sp.]HIL28095.1 hypothetical protein [Micavibrio sp.]